MLSQEIITILEKNIERYEGKVNHLYLDSKGFVTVGVGHLLTSIEAAQKLPFLRQSGGAASQEDIASEFLTIKQQEANRVASYYRQFTLLTLTDTSISELTREHIHRFYDELKIIYADFDTYPQEIRLALFDLIFNLGMTKLRKKWPKLNACIAERDWVAAADNCQRRGIANERNDYVKNLLLNSVDISIS